MSDLPTILLTLSIPGIIGLAGVWLGTRTLANDAALRKWRRQQVTPYLEAAKQRAHFWIEMLMETAVYEELSPEQTSKHISMREAGKRSALLDVREKLVDPDFHSLRLTSQTVPDKEFRAAFARFLESEEPLKPDVATAEIRGVMLRMEPALAALNEAAERYIFSSL
jgi:hypothetical protein